MLDTTHDPTRAQMLCLEGGPAFLRRARRVETALDEVLAVARHQRDRWLDMVKLRLATLAALSGSWDRLRPLLVDEAQVDLLVRLHAELKPTLLGPLGPTTSTRVLRTTLRELVDSLELFNRRWSQFVPGLDLTGVNEAREKYNRYYVLEKECAVGRAGLGKQDYVKLPPVGPDEIAKLLPPLPVPRLAP